VVIVAAYVSCFQSQLASNAAPAAPSNWALMNGRTPFDAMPANVFESERAMVTAGLAKEVDAVNQ